ncbi:MAG: DUF547 domain-containing protein [Candidatus Obscuribacterales bacterium]|nr:DUF547 domain-containing protein [Candidatus Obscuribacterales bacterium]
MIISLKKNRLAIPALAMSALSLLVLAPDSYILRLLPAQSAETNKDNLKRKFDQDYALLARELRHFVRDGEIDYTSWQKDQNGLNRFLKSLAELRSTEYETFSQSERLAFWLNAYNALIIKSVLDHYPISGKLAHYPPDSFRQIPGDWEAQKFTVMGKEITLYEIEHEKIRRDLPDARTHFAVVCASRSCAEIVARPYKAQTLDEDLDSAAKRFINDDENLLLDVPGRRFKVSKIFSWFTLDFAGKSGALNKFPPPSDQEIIAGYIMPYLTDENRNKLVTLLKNLPEVQFDYMPYDWSLNDAKTAKATN